MEVGAILTTFHFVRSGLAESLNTDAKCAHFFCKKCGLVEILNPDAKCPQPFSQEVCYTWEH